ncbi:long-chain fatty acid--CoA ligase [Bacillus sp. BRMEA1]|uniref:AMP-dependent synthetase/ligase n=1 Tax=Neobacillus endophyticus TaxID=2738405 RepID=UPI0015631429|nr:long-chain fatty acid--CoA ligase [Neobacillus endophyticus]NRD78074.1 long-chain fatty acid--CoA ligase [Neobacillus endophyticus]
MKVHNLVEMVSRSVHRFSEKDAFLWKKEGGYKGVSYHSFWMKVRQLAAGLAFYGIKQGDKVAILSENNPNWPISDLAILSLGAVSVPIHTTLPPEQIAFILDNADCSFIFIQNEHFLEKVLSIGHVTIPAAIFSPPKNHEDTESLFSMEQLIYLGSTHPLQNWETIWSELERDDLATIIHTSGTTGKPKGVMLTHGNILSNVEGVQFWVMEAKPSDLLLSHLPLSHVFERMAGQFMPLSVGATIAYAESMNKVQENLLEVRPTILVSVPLLFERVYAQAQKLVESGPSLRKKIFQWALEVGAKKYDYYVHKTVDEMLTNGYLPKEIRFTWKLANALVYKKVKQKLGGRIRGVISGGGALNPEIAKFFWSVDIPALEGYGLTETSPVVCVNPMIRSKVGTVGKPLPNLDIQIAPDGEVMVKGPSVMKGYYKDETATAEVFRDGWFLTGDIGRMDEDGFLKIVDRKKRIIVLRTGKNVAPQPVENAIQQSVYISNAVLIGQDQKYVIALITPSMEELLPWAKRKGFSTDMELLLKKAEVQQLLISEVAKFTKGFAKFEQPKKVVIIGKEWTVDDGELTPSLKVRIPEIQKKYKDAIDLAYAEDTFMDIQIAANEVAVGISLRDF